MTFGFSASVGSFDAAMKAVERDLAQGVTADNKEVTGFVKGELRGQIEAAFDNPSRLANTVRARSYPEGGKTSLEPASLVWTKAPAIIDAYARGVTIRAHGKRWLAIPTEAAGKRVSSGGGSMRGNPAWERISPKGFERATGLDLVFVLDPKSRGRKAYLMVNQAMLSGRGKSTPLARPYRGKGRGSRLYGPSGRSIIVFILVAQVRVPKRLDLDRVVTDAVAFFQTLIRNRWG